MRTNSPAARELLDHLKPGQVLEAGPAFEQAGQIWNGAVEHRPALIVRAESTEDVQVAVRVARRCRLPLSVRGGGHDWAGRALRQDGLVVDLTEMRQVTVDADQSVATVAGGAHAADVIAAGAPYELVAATGAVGGVGFAGLTLGGGYGPLNGRFGLAVDNILGAEVVLADGRVVTADATHEPELYWALRGGGGNFGVVTSMRVRLHRIPRLLAGLIMFPWAEATHVWKALNELLPNVPDELTVQTGVLSAPDGQPVMFVSPAWSGDDLARGEQAIDVLRQLGTPVMSQVGPMSYGDMLRLQDPFIAYGRHYAIRTRNVAGFTPDVVAALSEAGSSRTSPLTGIAIHHAHGATTRVDIGGTAFGYRQNHFVIEIVAAWEPGDGAEHIKWVDAVSASLAPSALPGGYANLLATGEHDQIAHAYGPNAQRLLAAKAHYDPDSVFIGIPLPGS